MQKEKIYTNIVAQRNLYQKKWYVTCIMLINWATSTTFNARMSSQSFFIVAGGGPFISSSSTRTNGLSSLDANFSPCFSNASAAHESLAMTGGSEALCASAASPR